MMLSRGMLHFKCGQPRVSIVLTQVSCYRVPPLQPSNVIKTVNKQLTPYPDQMFKKTHNIFEDFKVDKSHHQNMERKRRKLWAKFGSASKVDPSVLFPTEQEINEEITAERTWWPSLHHMKENIELKNKEEHLKKEKRERIISEKMAMMPKWIAEFQKEQEVVKKKERNIKEVKQTQLEVSQEKFGFEISQHHPSLLQYYEEDKERKKAAKKAEKKLKKLEKKNN